MVYNGERRTAVLHILSQVSESHVKVAEETETVMGGVPSASPITAGSMNLGVLKSPLQPTDWRRGMVSGISGVELEEDADWTEYLPPLELQYAPTFDTMACVTFSALNILEILYKRVVGESINFSDRYTATASGTTRQGNYLTKVADTIRHKGLVAESEYPFGGETWEEYYKPLTSDLNASGRAILDELDIEYEWVHPTPLSMLDALKEAPLQVTITYTAGEGILPRKEGKEEHAVAIFQGVENEYWRFYDSYDQAIKTVAWDYRFFSCLKYNLLYKQPMLKLPDNCLVQDVEGTGEFGMHLNGKIYLDDLAKILSTVVMRNTKWPERRPLKKDQWNAFPKYNLKNEPL